MMRRGPVTGPSSLGSANWGMTVRGQVGRVAVFVALGVVVVGILVGGVAANRVADEPEQRAATTAPADVADELYPLASGPTADEIQLVVFERAYSECATYDLAGLASKYNVANTSKESVATAVGRAWASYFNAGRDAVRDGRAGCLQGAAGSQ
jgi:hypothetical protein